MSDGPFSCDAGHIFPSILAIEASTLRTMLVSMIKKQNYFYNLTRPKNMFFSSNGLSNIERVGR